MSLNASALNRAKSNSSVGTPAAPVFASTPGEIVELLIADLDLVDMPFQRRFETRTADLRGSIEREGQIDPIDALGKSSPFKIIDGHQRVATLKEIGRLTVRARIWAGITEATAHELAFIKNSVRRNLRPIERASAIREARKRGHTLESLAAALGKSVRQLQRDESLLTLSTELQDLVDEGEITVAHAAVFSRCPTNPKLVDWVERVQENKWSAAMLWRELRREFSTEVPLMERRFVKCSGSEVRMYAWRLGARSSQRDRDRAVAAMEKAIALLRRVDDAKCTLSPSASTVEAAKQHAKPASRKR